MKNLITSILLLATIAGSPAKTHPPVEEPVVVEENNQYVTNNSLSPNERETLRFLQEQGITDKMALSVIMGNIKQESKFHPNICEGGARVAYTDCHRGGYGLIQWTTSFRYWGLGQHAALIAGDASSLQTQLSYMTTEREWERAKQMFVVPDKTMDYYMKGAYIWLGWGVYGNRGVYSQEYYNLLT